MNNSQNLSLLIKSQLPEYIKSDPAYDNFVAFLQAYYEWMEQNGGALSGTKNILNYIDIDNTSNDFIKYFTNDFLQHFPEDALVDKSLAVKVARELYKSKGTIASYKFLFRVLFNSDFDVFATKDAVLRASDGIWYVPQSLKLATTDPNFLDVQNLKIFGETSKSFAIIENSVLAGNKTEIFISNIERLFQSGETVRILDGNNQDVLVNGAPLRAKLVGQISQININPKNRGLLYKPGDPVVVYGGLNETTVNPIGATAEVGKTTTGSIQNINVTNGGFGYTMYPNTSITIKNAPGAIADIASVVSTLPPSYIITNSGTGYTINDQVVVGNTSSYFTFADVTAVSESGQITQITYRPGIDVNTIFGITANVISKNITAANASITISSTAGNGLANATYVVKDTISLKTNEVHSGHAGGFLLGNTTNPVSYYFQKMPTANINTKLSDAFSFAAFSTYSISSVIVQNGGGDISTLPVISADSTYITDVYDPNDAANTLGQNIQGKLSNLGILAPIQIINPGVGYVVNDKIIFNGGSGYGAAANVTAVNATGGITAIDYVYNTSSITYSLGGMGYTPDRLPSVTVQSANVSATGASIIVPGILGYGATFSTTVDRVGSVTTINVLNYGEDYITTPNVSLKVQDIVVSNVAITNLPVKNDIIYQGSNPNTASYIASVDTISQLTSDADPTKSLYNLRVFNYSTLPNPKLTLKILDNESISITMANSAYSANNFYPGSPEYNTNGIKVYGNGTARATASFLNGLTIGQGEYLSTQGQPSSFSVLQSELYNNYTYEIIVEKEIEKYRDILLNLLHPTGMKLLGKYLIKSNTVFDYHTQSALYQGKNLADYTGYIASNITMDADFVNYSTNIVKFNNIVGADISNFITSNSVISILPRTGNDIRSEVVGIDAINNTITLKNSVWLTYPNVAHMSGTQSSNTLYVDSLTGTYDIINNGNYSNTQNHLEDVVFPGDRIGVNPGNIQFVSRSSIATYYNSVGVLSTAAIDTARYDYDPVTLQPKGLLLEDSATNIFTYSQDFNQSVWNKIDSSVGNYLTPFLTSTSNNFLDVTSNYLLVKSTSSAAKIPAPDGTVSSDKFIESPLTGNPRISYITNVAADSQYTLTIFAKEDITTAKRYLTLLFPSSKFELNRYATFDLSTGTYVKTNSPDFVSITAVGNGWYRCRVTVTARASGIAELQIRLSTTAQDTLLPYAGDGISGMYIWGSQFELGSAATSYIKTTGVSTTRAADITYIPGVYTVKSVDYTNKIITLTSNLTETVNNIVSINRTLHAGGTVSTKNQVTIFGPLGTQYLPELVTEDLRNLITEDGKLIIL